MAKVPFKRIRERAAKRKGGDKVLTSLLPKKPNNKALAKLGDDRVLSEMAARVFSADISSSSPRVSTNSG